MNKKLYIELLEREVETLRMTVDTRDEEIKLWREDQSESLKLIDSLDDKVEDLKSSLSRTERELVNVNNDLISVSGKYANLIEKNLIMKAELEEARAIISGKRSEIETIENERDTWYDRAQKMELVAAEYDFIKENVVPMLENLRNEILYRQSNGINELTDLDVLTKNIIGFIQKPTVSP